MDVNDLNKTVRSQRILNGAWHAIRRNAETSRKAETREEARKLGNELPSKLRSLSDRLRKGYHFSPAFGATPSKGKGKKGKRPLVVAPIQDRIIQRAVLDTLTECKELSNVQSVLRTKTSVGGIPQRGVENAIELLDQCVANGDRFIAASDIAGFFTKIPRDRVLEYVGRDTEDKDFLGLLDRALTVELANEATLPTEDRKLFPTGNDGVAQGCPLSALAGNIVLKCFDTEMNEEGRGITCIRYIDDFVLVGRTRKKVVAAMKSAKQKLARLGMDVYDPETDPDKAFVGEIGNGHVFLGYELEPGRYPPAQKSRDRLIGQVEALLKNGRTTIKKAKSGKKLSSSDRAYIQTLTAIDNTLKGWRGSYQSSNCDEVFLAIDAEVQRRLRDFDGFFRRSIRDEGDAVRRRMLGVKNLSDGLPPKVSQKN